MNKTFKVVAIVDSANSQQLDYVTNQIQAIQNEFSEVTFEIENENSSYLDLYCKHKRVPCYMIFKNNIYKTHKQGKLDNNQAVNWIKLTTS